MTNMILVTAFAEAIGSDLPDSVADVQWLCDVAQHLALAPPINALWVEKPDGTIPAPSVKRLTEIGAWMARNGESIYGRGQAGRLWEAYPHLDFTSTVGPFTHTGKTVYAHALKWPGRRITIGAERSRVKAASFLASGEPIAFEQCGQRIFLNDLPRKAPDPLDTVIKLDLAG